MAKGLCCLAQSNGDLGKPLEISFLNKNNVLVHRCGVCEVVQSCSDDPQKHPPHPVFRFRFLPGTECNLTTGKCAVTAAGMQQYARDRTEAAAGRELTYFVPEISGTNGHYTSIGASHRITAPKPYLLPSP